MIIAKRQLHLAPSPRPVMLTVSHDLQLPGPLLLHQAPRRRKRNPQRRNPRHLHLPAVSMRSHLWRLTVCQHSPGRNGLQPSSLPFTRVWGLPLTPGSCMRTDRAWSTLFKTSLTWYIQNPDTMLSSVIRYSIWFASLHNLFAKMTNTLLLG